MIALQRAITLLFLQYEALDVNGLSFIPERMNGEREREKERALLKPIFCVARIDDVDTVPIEPISGSENTRVTKVMTA